MAELWNDLGRRGRIALIAGVVALVLVIPALAVGPMARSRVAKRALSHGLVAEVGRVRPSFGGLWLLDVSLKSQESGRLDGRVDAVFVPFGDRAIEVHGGRVALRGKPGEVRAALRNRAERSEGGGRSRALRVDGIALRWTELDERKSDVEAFGLALERGQTDTISADLVRFHSPGAALSARRAVVSGVDRSGRFGQVRLGALDAVLEPNPPTPAEPAPAPPAPAAATAAPAVTGAAPAVATTAPATAAKLAALTALLKERVPEGATLAIDRARLEVSFGHERVGIGPSRFSLRRSPEELGFELSPVEGSAAGATPLALRGHLPLPEGLPSLEVEGGPVSLGMLGVKDGELGLRRTRDASVEAHVRLALLPGGIVQASGSGAIVNLALQRPELGPRELTGLRLAFRGNADVALDGSRLRVGDSEVSIGDVKLAGNLELERDGAALKLRGSGGVPLASCDAMLGSLPPALIGELAGLRLTGTFALTSSVEYDSARPADLVVKLKVANDCRVVDAPAAFAPERFRSAWTREIKAPDGSSVLADSGPGTADYTRYPQISRYMETAVLVCEDGGFYRHRGFDFRAIEKALREDLLARRFVRGASTISMQLAKNLYLGREKTLSRKVQEALLTMLLEERLSKQEIMELYLNIVELGPGIYGVGQAAEHYFAKPASELSLAQALYLASILPDPTRQHFSPDGSISPRWDQYLKKLMNIARQVKLITDEELAAGLEEEIAFRKPGESGALPVANGGEAPDDSLAPAPDFDSLGP
ncbi:MAG TPA: biosynthetic peptidoglycan transglycosylase [Polyangiaceae bacterium]